MLPSLANIYWLGIKELFSLSRDVVLIFLIAYAFTYEVYGPAQHVSLEVENASIAIVDEDHSLVSQRILDAFLPPFFLRPVLIPAGDIDRSMDAGRYTFIVDVPPDFQRDLERGKRPAIQVNVDATAMSQAGRGAAYIQQILAMEIAEALGHPGKPASPPVNIAVRVKFNPNLISAWFMAVVQIVNSITLLALFLCGAAVIREREHGTIDHLLVMPLRPIEIMLAKVWSNGLVIVAGAMLSLLVVAKGLLQVPIAGSLSLFLGGTVLYVFAITALGIFLATLVRSMPQFGLLALPVYIVLHLLSGGMTPMDSMPLTLQRLMYLSPSTHFVNFAQAVLYRGAGLEAIWPECAAIAVQGAVFFAIALARFRHMVVHIQAG